MNETTAKTATPPQDGPYIKAKPTSLHDATEDRNLATQNVDFNPTLKLPVRQQELLAGLRKLRVGDYRVIYAILGSQVLVLRIGHRREIYEK